MWVRLDDGMAHHPKFVRSGPEAMALYVAGLCYCNRYRTDGLIPKLVLPSLLPGLSEHRAMELALRLATNAARPSWIDAGDHYRVHDYGVYQPTNCEAPGESPRRGAAAADDGRWGDVTRDVTGDVTPDRDAEGGVTRYRNAPERYERYGDAPLPEPLPPPRPVPMRRVMATAPASSGWEEDREQSRRAQNAARQRRFRVRHAARGGGVTRDVTRNGHAADAECEGSPGPGPGSAGGPRAALSPEERVRAQNAERQRRFRRRRQAAHRAEAAHAITLDRNGARQAPGEAPPPTAPVRPVRDLGVEFAAWFAAYPRQEAEIPAWRAWMAEPELPPVELMLERLAAQKAAKPDAYYWLAPDRYLREKRWRDQPPPAPARAVQARSVWAQLRAMGSDEGRRQRLREISAAARFDPFDPGASRG
jgi:hypothetical protein